MSLAISLIHYVSEALYVLILARILLSWLPISPWHPLARGLRAIVDPILRPFRRILPSIAGIDFSPLLAILVIFFVAQLATQALLDFQYGGRIDLGADVITLIGQLLLNILIVLGVLVLLRFLVSLFSVDPWHPLVMGIRTMTNPLVRPFTGFASRQAYGARSAVDSPALITLVVYVALYVAIDVVFESFLPRYL